MTQKGREFLSPFGSDAVIFPSNAVTRESNSAFGPIHAIMRAAKEKQEVAGLEFHQRLRQLRTQKGISQRELAEQIHISRSAVAKWENGLGLPGEESARLLAEFFGVTVEELLPSQGGDSRLVEKNVIISRQQKIILALAAVLGVLLVLLAAYLYRPFLEYVPAFFLGGIFMALGVFNLRGNIASIHWYHRRKVTKQDQKPYCRLMGAGTVIIGAGTACYAVLEPVFQADWVDYLEICCVVAGLAIMCFAQFKYNKGIF